MTLAIMFFTNGINILALAAFVFGIILVVGSLSRFSECGNREDERLKKIAAFSMMNSWISGITLLSMLLFFTYFKWMSTLSSVQVMSLTIVLMLLTFYGWYVYYSFKGDVA
jgi:uncharacterized membrane protein